MNSKILFIGPIVIFVVLVLTFTFLAVSTYNASEPLGTLRRFSSLLPKVFQLVAFGGLLSIVATIGMKRVRSNILVYPPLFLILLDLDHLPSLFGIDQPIRPAHSLIFLLISLIAIFAFESRRPAIPLTLMSSFLGHLGVDSPLFPLFAPISSELYSFSTIISMTLVLSSIILAMISGRMYQRAESEKNDRLEFSITDAPSTHLSRDCS